MSNRPVKLIIRDDDVNFFTKCEDLDGIYKEIEGFPISFAVIPYVVEAGACPDIKGNAAPRFIGDNKELVEYFKKLYREGKCDLLMHGLTHEYHYCSGRKISEMIWRANDNKTLDKMLLEAKQDMEKVFEAPFNCFVAPHNDINLTGIKSLPLGMNYSGIVSIRYNREYSIKALVNYCKRCWCRILYGIPYPGVLSYSKRKEINACSVRNYNYLIGIYNYCKKRELPMAINVHYWHIRDYPEKYVDFFKFIRYAIQDGAKPSRMRDCF